MGQISYYLATSLDGYLAREDDAVDWLLPYQSKLETPYDYEAYYATVSAVIMGRRTWDVARSFDDKPYHDRPCYVFTRNKWFSPEYPYVRVSELIPEQIRAIKAAHTGRIWLTGGADIASTLIEMGELDEIVQTIAPVTIGSGIPWLKPSSKQSAWRLKEALRTKIGLLQLVYERSQ